MKTFFKLLLVIFTLSFTVAPEDVSAQKYSQYTFEVDTATNAETITFEVPYDIKWPATYQWVVDQTVISGSVTSVTTTLLSSSDPASGRSYASVATDSTNGDFTMTGTHYGVRQKLSLVTAGTQSSSYKVTVFYKEIQ